MGLDHSKYRPVLQEPLTSSQKAVELLRRSCWPAQAHSCSHGLLKHPVKATQHPDDGLTSILHPAGYRKVVGGEELKGQDQMLRPEHPITGEVWSSPPSPEGLLNTLLCARAALATELVAFAVPQHVCKAL
jgi:hypothetical protein